MFTDSFGPVPQPTKYRAVLWCNFRQCNLWQVPLYWNSDRIKLLIKNVRTMHPKSFDIDQAIWGCLAKNVPSVEQVNSSILTLRVSLNLQFYFFYLFVASSGGDHPESILWRFDCDLAGEPDVVISPPPPPPPPSAAVSRTTTLWPILEEVPTGVPVQKELQTHATVIVNVDQKETCL